METYLTLLDKAAKEYGESHSSGEWFERLRIEAFKAGATTIYQTYIAPLQEQNKKLRKALQLIEQMSDPGSYARAIVDMKSIASNALKQ